MSPKAQLWLEKQIHKSLSRNAQQILLIALQAAVHNELLARCTPSSILANLPRGLREVAFAYRLDTHSAVLLGQGEARSYPDPPEPACGTVDVLSVSEAAVWDYKSGWPLRAAESLQLQALALYAARTFGWLRVTAGHLRIERDRLYPDAIEFGPVDLAAIHVRVARIYKRYAQAALAPGQEVYPGPHCTSCAAAPACPATTLLIAQVAQALNSEMWRSDKAAATHYELLDPVRMIRKGHDMRIINIGYWKGLSTADPDGLWKATQQLFHLVAEVAQLGPQDRRVLDVGCGYGTNSIYCIKHFGPQKMIGLNKCLWAYAVSRRDGRSWLHIEYFSSIQDNALGSYPRWIFKNKLHELANIDAMLLAICFSFFWYPWDYVVIRARKPKFASASH